MIPLLESLAEVERKVCAAPGLAVFLDYDGTLASIAGRPDEARLAPGVRPLLETLAHNAGTTVAVISGRALEDLRSRVGVSGLIYAGNHGLEISWGEGRFVHAGAAGRKESLVRLSSEIESRCALWPGATVEFKGLTATVHFRRVPAEDRPRLCRLVRKVAAARGNGFVVRRGRCSLEIRPDVPWGKGEAVHFIRTRLSVPGSLAICMGDDRTDEDAFAALPDGITVRVGRSEASAARYNVRDVAQVRHFLEWLCAAAAPARVVGAS